LEFNLSWIETAGSHDGAIVIFAQADAAYARIRNRRWSVGFGRQGEPDKD